MSRIFHSKPYVYGAGYLALIPAYALIFYLFPQMLGEEKTFITYFYFSTVTITTLGYGDIIPHGDLGKLVASSESVFGIMLIGLFLNSLSRARSEVTQAEEAEKTKILYKESEVTKLLGHYNLIEPLILKYKSSVIQITQPLSDRKNEYNPDFTLNDMKDLYGPSMMMTKNYNTPAINYYFKDLELLSGELSDLVKTVDLRLFPTVENICLSFLSSYYSFDFSESILGMPKMKAGEDSMKDNVKELLESHEGEPKFLESNLINGYIALHHQIKDQMKLLELMKTSVEIYRPES